MASTENEDMYNRAVELARNYITQRKAAYCRVFNIQGVDAKVVLQDLANFCRANESTYTQDPRLSDRLDGRREVWLRIQQHLQLTDEQLWSLYRLPKA